MDWNTFLNSKWFRGGLSALLVLAISLTLCWPGSQLHTLEPESPLENETVREISYLELGNGDGASSQIEEPDDDLPETEETEPQETEPEETEPQETQLREMENDIPGEDDDIAQDGTGAEEDSESDSGSPEEEVQPLDVALSFVWWGEKTGKKTKICSPGASVSDSVAVTQLSGGGISYRLSLTGTDGGEGQIIKASYVSQSGKSSKLNTPSGKLAMELPEGEISNRYTITVTALVKGEYVTFTVYLTLAYDVRLEMTYWVDGAKLTERCEAGKTVTAETVYDDQLTDDRLEYKMALVGSQAEDLTIRSVTCYHSGNRKTETLAASGSATLLLKDGKTGENTFTVKAGDAEGNVYTFTINIPYKHRGEDSVRIETNLENGSTVINEAQTNLTVEAWSEDGSGKVISYIPANGTDTTLIVMLDGVTLNYVSTSGKKSEYHFCAENPKVGDNNTHTLYIYAEDSYGNYGELTMTLNGQRNEAGQKIGTATIRIDLTALGLGVVETLSYDVLADEPISYVVEKAIAGKDLGDIYGSASDTLGWAVQHSGTLDTGYYLQSISTGYTPNALEGSRWSGSTEEEVLSAIDERFGKGTGLATLWRCIYRNGLNKSAGSGSSIGEFDYTSGSGWMYSIGSSYYPGQSMSHMYLKDGDVLTLRFTLAYGWDVGSGSTGYGNSVGYCVTAVNGSFNIKHQMETVTNADGSVSYVCHCCGLEEKCTHEHTEYRDLGNGTHTLYCEDCQTTIGDGEEHIWDTGAANTDAHICSVCGSGEAHIWQEVEGTSTATCTEDGVKTMRCAICGMERQVTAAAKGHTYNNTWHYTASGHYRTCSVCGEQFDQGSHSYVYDAGWDDYTCSVCGVLHDWDVECGGNLTVVSATCQKVVYYCNDCGRQLTKVGNFEEYHSYVGGSCQYCGKKDPNYTTEVIKPEETEPEETEPETTD